VGRGLFSTLWVTIHQIADFFGPMHIQLSDLSFQSIITVFKHDTTGQPSLELVRLLNRMVKERHYRVHPKVISSLLHLRLKSELHVRSSDLRADREEKDTGAKLKGKKKEKVHLSKKAKKARKERKEIEQEMEEAEAEVDAEDRAKTVGHVDTTMATRTNSFSALAYRNPKAPIRPLLSHP
jgi:nucleolar complex protein 3